MSDDHEDPPNGRNGTDPKVFADRAVFSLCELLFLVFGLPFGEALYNDRTITVWNYFYLVIAILFAVGGPMWPLIRTRAWIPENVSRSLSRAATDARVWIVVLLVLFIYGTGPELYNRVTYLHQIVIHDAPTSEDFSKHKVQQASDTARIADLTVQVASLKEQLRAKEIEEMTQSSLDQVRMPRRLLTAIGDVFGQARVKQSELYETAKRIEKAEAEAQKNKDQFIQSISYSVPPCRLIVSSTVDNQNFAKVIEAIAESQGCQAQDTPPPPPLSHPIDADAPPTVLPDPNSYVVVRYPRPEGVKNLPEPPGEISLHEGISQEINDKAAEFKDKMADNLATALHSCRLDARRSYKAEGVQGWPVDKWTIYVDLGKVQMCQ
jgi:hypothetical protein